MASGPDKLFSDPVHGFISVPRNVLLDLIQTPEVQRLRRIRQLGVGYLVFPGAEHTRFTHALGAMALMSDTLDVLASKGTPISEEERRAALVAALLHDIGHGPFSHTLEHTLIDGFEHEAMSRALLIRLSERFEGAFDLAVAIFDDAYERPFFHQLVASQLDMDRLDYLRRDSFYTGVVEGRVGIERILKTLRVHPVDGGSTARLVIEEKGIYAAENFLMARRLMFWQVYLHKTVLAGDQVLQSAFERARTLLREDQRGAVAGCSPVLQFFLEHELTVEDVRRPDVCNHYTALDDADVLYSLKRWQESSDPILADLSRRFVNRDLFRTTFLSAENADIDLQPWQDGVAEYLLDKNLSSPDQLENDLSYYLRAGRSRHSAYERIDGTIAVLTREGRVHELSNIADTAAVESLTPLIEKPYVCCPKEARLKEVATHD